MVKLNKIYTKTGDTGTTGLGDGTRVPKTDVRIAAYGTVDELNAAIGVARTHTDGVLDDALARVQNDLFDLGADLCTPETEDKPDYEPLRMVDHQTLRLEGEIDAWNSMLEPLRSFILPGGTPAAAALHLARTIARRAERLMVQLDAQDDTVVNPYGLTYINRLSDHLFVAARIANNNGADDVLWVPGANRDT